MSQWLNPSTNHPQIQDYRLSSDSSSWVIHGICSYDQLMIRSGPTAMFVVSYTHEYYIDISPIHQPFTSSPSFFLASTLLSETVGPHLPFKSGIMGKPLIIHWLFRENLPSGCPIHLPIHLQNIISTCMIIGIIGYPLLVLVYNHSYHINIPLTIQ